MTDKVTQLKPEETKPKEKTRDGPDGSKIVTLNSPLDVPGRADKVREITLKEPRAGVMLKHGIPWRQEYLVKDNTPVGFQVEFYPDKMAVYIEEMSGIDRLSLESLGARDMHTIFQAVMAILQPGERL